MNYKDIMDNKIKVSIAVLISLVCFYMYDRSTQNQYHDAFVKIFNFDHSKINKIIIFQNEDGIELEKVDSVWVINGQDSLQIKQNSIDTFFDKTINVKRSSLSISDNSKDLSIYSLDDSSSVQLIVLNNTGDTLGKGIFGINKTNYFSNYYKEFENNKIYKTDSNILSFLTVNLRYWGEEPKMDTVDSTNIALPAPNTNK